MKSKRCGRVRRGSCKNKSRKSNKSKKLQTKGHGSPDSTYFSFSRLEVPAHGSTSCRVIRGVRAETLRQTAAGGLTGASPPPHMENNETSETHKFTEPQKTVTTGSCEPLRVLSQASRPEDNTTGGLIFNIPRLHLFKAYPTARSCAH